MSMLIIKQLKVLFLCFTPFLVWWSLSLLLRALWSGHGGGAEGRWCLEPFPRTTLMFMMMVLSQSETHLGSFI